MDFLPQRPDDDQLAALLHAQGEHALLKGDCSGISLFDEASRLAPRQPELFYKQGLALLEYASLEKKEKVLLLANKKFRTAISLDPSLLAAWQAWGASLSLLGSLTSEHHYVLEAEEKLRQALHLSQDTANDFLADLYWEYGSVRARIAHRSGEALDWQLALDSFQKAANAHEITDPEFWIDFGSANFQLAEKINDVRLYVRAVHCFKHAVSSHPHAFRGWMCLARSINMLYALSHDEDHFVQANDCFSTAVQLQPHDAEVWLEWALFLCESGRKQRDIKRLRLCIEKCHKAYACGSGEPLIVATWAEALALIGEITDRLDLLSEAQNKIAEALEVDDGDPSLLYSWGMVLCAFGSYFNDLDYYYQAIEKFQSALSLDRTLSRQWHAIAIAYAAIGEMDADPNAFEKACRFFSKAIELRPTTSLIYDCARTLLRLGEMTHNQAILERAATQFEYALGLQKNAPYLHPDWLFHYASTLDLLADFYDDESFYLKSIEIFTHVLMVDPDYPHIHHRLALTLSHLGDLLEEAEYFQRALHHFRLAARQEEENDQITLDWGVALINLARHTDNPGEADLLFRDAEHKLIQAARLGNAGAYYHLGCLYSLQGLYDKAMGFIEKAEKSQTLPSLDELLQDDWLEGLRGTQIFRELLSRLERKLA
jgi:tetratricopeptide (TPR) repeat protein